MYISVVLTEISRYLGYYIYAWAFAKADVAVPRDSSKKSLLGFSLASASGIIICETLFFYGDVFVSTFDVGVYFDGECYWPQPLIMGIRSFLFSILNICWNVFAFYAYASGNYIIPIVITIIHCGTSAIVYILFFRQIYLLNGVFYKQY